MEIRDDLKFSKEHEWILEDGGNTITVGITDYAQDKLGDVVFVELPEVGTLVDAGEAVGSIESVKAVSELFSPVAGEIVEINKDLEDEPELVNTSP
ncbi:MAG: glycine cleavage system H protein, partial [bacterium]